MSSIGVAVLPSPLVLQPDADIRGIGGTLPFLRLAVFIATAGVAILIAITALLFDYIKEEKPRKLWSGKHMEVEA